MTLSTTSFLDIHAAHLKLFPGPWSLVSKLLKYIACFAFKEKMGGSEWPSCGQLVLCRSSAHRQSIRKQELSFIQGRSFHWPQMMCGYKSTSSQSLPSKWVYGSGMPSPWWKVTAEGLARMQSSLQFSRSVTSDSLWPHEPQHTRPPCPSPTPGVHPKPCPLSWWWHPTTSSSVVPFSSCPQSFPASGSFPVSQLFASGGQIIGVLASASVLPMNTQDWSPLG